MREIRHLASDTLRGLPGKRKHEAGVHLHIRQVEECKSVRGQSEQITVDVSGFELSAWVVSGITRELEALGP